MAAARRVTREQLARIRASTNYFVPDTLLQLEDLQQTIAVESAYHMTHESRQARAHRTVLQEQVASCRACDGPNHHKAGNIYEGAGEDETERGEHILADIRERRARRASERGLMRE
jgi:hypothetical protein